MPQATGQSRLPLVGGVFFVRLKIQGCAALGIESQKADVAAVVITMDDRNWDDAEGV